VLCVSYACEYSVAPAYARTRPAAPRQRSGVSQTPHLTSRPRAGTPPPLHTDHCHWIWMWLTGNWCVWGGMGERCDYVTLQNRRDRCGVVRGTGVRVRLRCILIYMCIRDLCAALCVCWWCAVFSCVCVFHIDIYVHSILGVVWRGCEPKVRSSYY